MSVPLRILGMRIGGWLDFDRFPPVRPIEHAFTAATEEYGAGGIGAMGAPLSPATGVAARSCDLFEASFEPTNVGAFDVSLSNSTAMRIRASEGDCAGFSEAQVRFIDHRIAKALAAQHVVDHFRRHRLFV